MKMYLVTEIGDTIEEVNTDCRKKSYIITDEMLDTIKRNSKELCTVDNNTVSLIPKKEKIMLDVPPVVVYNGENWSVGKVNHMDSSVDIWRNVKVKTKGYEYYDIATKKVSASDLYKADTRCMPLHDLGNFC